MKKLEFRSPIMCVRGTVKDSDVVFSVINGRQCTRKRVKPGNPSTEEQVKIRTIMGTVTRAWRELSHAQRGGWQRCAEKYYPISVTKEMIYASGHQTFLRVNATRMQIGLPMAFDAPTNPPPRAAVSIQQCDSPDAGTTVLRIRHKHKDTSGLLIAVRATPPNTRSCGSLRWICGVGPQSAQPLLASGGKYIFSPVRFPVNQGQPYLVEVRIIRAADGLMSRRVCGDFRKVVRRRET